MKRSCTKISCKEIKKKSKVIEYTVLDEIKENEVPKALENQEQ